MKISNHENKLRPVVYERAGTGHIITPSFTSSEQARRRSDLLLQKKESSCLARNSVESFSNDPFAVRDSSVSIRKRDSRLS